MNKRFFFILFLSVILLGVLAVINYLDENTSKKCFQPDLQQNNNDEWVLSVDYFNHLLTIIDANGVDELIETGKEIFESYVWYRAALGKIDTGFKEGMVNVNYLNAINKKILALQAHYFNPFERRLLFEEENRIRNIALTKLRVKLAEGGGEKFHQRWQEILSKQPEYIKISDHNSALLAKIVETNGLAFNDRFKSLVSLVGVEGAEKLMAVEKKQLLYDIKAQRYLNERKKVLQEENLTEEEINVRIELLRDRYFEHDEIRRLIALERIYDNKIRD